MTRSQGKSEEERAKALLGESAYVLSPTRFLPEWHIGYKKGSFRIPVGSGASFEEAIRDADLAAQKKRIGKYRLEPKP